MSESFRYIAKGNEQYKEKVSKEAVTLMVKIFNVWEDVIRDIHLGQLKEELIE